MTYLYWLSRSGCIPRVHSSVFRYTYSHREKREQIKYLSFSWCQMHTGSNHKSIVCPVLTCSVALCCVVTVFRLQPTARGSDEETSCYAGRNQEPHSSGDLQHSWKKAKRVFCAMLKTREDFFHLLPRISGASTKGSWNFHFSGTNVGQGWKVLQYYVIWISTKSAKALGR